MFLIYSPINSPPYIESYLFATVEVHLSKVLSARRFILVLLVGETVRHAARLERNSVLILTSFITMLLICSHECKIALCGCVVYLINCPICSGCIAGV